MKPTEMALLHFFQHLPIQLENVSTFSNRVRKSVGHFPTLKVTVSDIFHSTNYQPYLSDKERFPEKLT